MRQRLSAFKADFFKALAHPLRISLLDALRAGERSVTELAKGVGGEPTNVSQQLAVLRNRNIVITRKEGLNVYYSVVDPLVFELLDVAKEIFNHNLVGIQHMLLELEEEPRTGAEVEG